jgi:hypothetical protein
MTHLNMQRYVQTLAALMFACLLQSTYAALPPTLNYQGHLTDNSGAPVDGTVSMTFNIYDTDAGGTALWSDTRSV